MCEEAPTCPSTLLAASEQLEWLGVVAVSLSLSPSPLSSCDCPPYLLATATLAFLSAMKPTAYTESPLLLSQLLPHLPTLSLPLSPFVPTGTGSPKARREHAGGGSPVCPLHPASAPEALALRLPPVFLSCFQLFSHPFHSRPPLSLRVSGRLIVRAFHFSLLFDVLLLFNHLQKLVWQCRHGLGWQCRAALQLQFIQLGAVFTPLLISQDNTIECPHNTTQTLAWSLPPNVAPTTKALQACGGKLGRQVGAASWGPGFHWQAPQKALAAPASELLLTMQCASLLNTAA